MSDTTNGGDPHAGDQTVPQVDQQPLPAAPQLPPQAPSQEVVELRAQVSTLTDMVQRLMQMQATQPQAQPQLTPVNVAPVYPQAPQFAAPGAVGFNDPEYYIRIKPYDPKRGYVRKRQFFDEIGRAIDGGDGKPGSIPEWYLVDRERAIQLSRYRQDPNNPMSPPVLDIVTPQEREQIDHAESQHRAATLGLLGMTPQHVQSAAREAGKINARVAGAQGATMPQQVPIAVREQPAIVGGAQVYQQQSAAQQVHAAVNAPVINQPQMPPVAPQPGYQQPTEPLPTNVAGRAAALSEVGAVGPRPIQGQDAQPLPPPPPVATAPATRGVAEDLTAEANRDSAAKEAIEAAAPYMNRTE